MYVKLDICAILSEIDFSEEEIELYKKYREAAGSRLDSIKADYLVRKMDIKEALKLAKEALPDIHEYTVELLFVLECTDVIYDGCMKTKLGRELFINTMRDIRCKVTECLNRKHIFGTYVGSWYNRFIFLSCYALGRLQYDVTTYQGSAVHLGEHVLEEGDFALSCHIPSMGRLGHEECIASYKMAYEFFYDRLTNGVLPIICCYSWLLYPNYLSVFGETSNTGLFARDFYIYKSDTSPEVGRGIVLSAVFNSPKETPLDRLLLNTTMQRKFYKYLRTNEEAYGVDSGVLFFDGGKVLNEGLR